MRVIVDTSVFVRACLGSVSCREVVTACLADVHTLVLSDILLAEYDGVPGQRRLAERLDLDAYVAARNAMVSAAAFHEPLDVGRVCRDAADDHLLALVRASKADLLITCDQDLLALGRFETAKITPPEAARSILEKG
jgi:putative PIN family toxin of toxin-antitoxin system